MERAISRFANEIAKELNLDENSRDVIAYGIFAIINTFVSILLVIIFGKIFNVLVEALLICIIGSAFRKYSGGAHMTSPINCAILGTIICVTQAKIFLHVIMPVTTVNTLISLGLVVFIISYYLTFKMAPVDSPSKPIRKKEIKIRMKKRSILVLSAYLIISGAFIIAYTFIADKRLFAYLLCIYGGITWQTFTLTRVGHSTIIKIDTFLNQILSFRRRV